jgi:hypothetical protein
MIRNWPNIFRSNALQNIIILRFLVCKYLCMPSRYIATLASVSAPPVPTYVHIGMYIAPLPYKNGCKWGSELSVNFSVPAESTTETKTPCQFLIVQYECSTREKVIFRPLHTPQGWQLVYFQTKNQITIWVYVFWRALKIKKKFVIL